VADTGIGIPAEKQRIILKRSSKRMRAPAGIWRDWSRSRYQPRTGKPSCGEIQLRSATGSGSTFTLYLPQMYAGPTSGGPAHAPILSMSTPPVVVTPQDRHAERVADDRDRLQPGDSVLLIVEDDAHYARMLYVLARDTGFKALVASSGSERCP